MQEPAALVPSPLWLSVPSETPTGEPGPPKGLECGDRLLLCSPAVRGNVLPSQEDVKEILGTIRAGIIHTTFQHPPAPRTDSQLCKRCLCAHHIWCRCLETAL